MIELKAYLAGHLADIFHHHHGPRMLMLQIKQKKFMHQALTCLAMSKRDTLCRCMSIMTLYCSLNAARK